MRQRFFSDSQAFTNIQATDLPSLSDQQGNLSISRINADGITGQMIQDIGNNTLGWRYPNHMAGPGAFLFCPLHQTTGYISSALGANDVTFHGVNILTAITVSRISFIVYVADVGKFASVGLYDINGNRMIHTGAVSTTTTGTKGTDITPVVILPGMYHWAYTTNSNTAEFLSIEEVPDYIALLNDGNVERYGFAANPSIAGVLPATLGALTADTGPTVLGVLHG